MSKIFEGFLKKMPLFEYLALSLIPLYLYKLILPNKYGELIHILNSSIKNLDTIIEFVFYYLFLMSVFIISFCIIFSVIYKPICMIYSKKYHRNQDDGIRFIDAYYKFFYGSQNRASAVFRWLWIITGYLYILYPSIIFEFIDKGNRVYNSLNFFTKFLLYFPGVIYLIFSVLSLYGILYMLMYEFLYLKSKINGPDKEAESSS